MELISQAYVKVELKQGGWESGAITVKILTPPWPNTPPPPTKLPVMVPQLTYSVCLAIIETVKSLLKLDYCMTHYNHGHILIIEIHM